VKSLRALARAEIDTGIRSVAVRKYLRIGDVAQHRKELASWLEAKDRWMLDRD
jgi:hypothetical protein